MPLWARIVFFAITALVVLAVHVYVYRRLVRDVTEHRGLRRLSAAVLVVMGIAGALARPLARQLPEGTLRPVVIGLLLWVGFVLFLLMSLLVADFVRWGTDRVRRYRTGSAELPADPTRRRVIAAGVSVASSVVAGGFTAFGAYRAFEGPVVQEIPVRLPGLPKALEGFRIAQLTDVHVGAVIQRKFIEELVTRTNGSRPDLVVITGDLVDGTVEHLGRYVAPFQNLSARYGSWFVTGNHDYYSGVDSWVAALQGLGIPSLRNRRVEIGEAGESFDLIGVDDWRGDYDLEQAISGRDPARASVLLSHQPNNVKKVAQEKLGLMVSGHTHGGQIFPANLIGGLIWGERNTGLSRVADSQFYVSRGCGFVGPPIRVAAPPEIPVLVLLSA
ncbi:MAG: metallophosphoesterase [Myxococcota bacterium]|nr:metallophosphoesterase [Myxococcota bacterium]